MSKIRGLEIIQAIKDNIEYYKIDAENDENYYKKVDDIINTYIKPSSTPSMILHRKSHVIYVHDSNKNRELFEEFCKINSSITETYAEQDLQDKIFEFLISNNSKELNQTTYSELLKFLNKIEVFNVTLVSMIKGLRFEKEEVLGNFRFRKIEYKDIDKVYGNTSLYKHIVDKHNDNINKEDQIYAFLEYHNTKIRIADDGTILSSNNHIKKLADIYREKFNTLLLFFSFLCPRLYNNPKYHLNMSIDDIFSTSENAIYIYDNLENPNYNKGGQIISSGSIPVSLRKDKFGYGIIKNKQDEELLLLIDKSRRGLEKNIYQAIIWAGKSTRAPNLDEAFVLLFMSLEALCPEKDINDFVAYYIGKDLQNRLKYKSIIGEMHTKRSLIVHQNSFASTVNFDDYRKLFDIVKQIIYKMHKELYKISTIEDLQGHLQTIKYS